MPFHIVRNDITQMVCEAVVNAANPSLLGGGGVDGAIHRAAGPALRAYCLELGGCEVGKAVASPGFGLPARWIFHTVGPVWCGGDRGEEALLRDCYRACLKLALEKDCRSVAFPLISAGAYGCPKDLALSVAVSEIAAFLLDHELEVFLVVYDKASYQLSAQRMGEIRAYIDETYVNTMPRPEHSRLAQKKLTLASMTKAERRARRKKDGVSSRPSAAAEDLAACRPPVFGKDAAACDPYEPRKNGEAAFFSVPQTPDHAAQAEYEMPCAASQPAYAAMAPASISREDLQNQLRSLDESFSQMLLRKIDEKGITDSACYKKANVDRKLFSKIRSDPHYRPSKPTAIAFAIALELPLSETRDLLQKAGYALSRSNKFDVIIEYFIRRGNYDIFEINEALFAFDQSLLGA